MSDNYNLDEAPESFKFVLGGHTYKMRYPTSEEVEKGSALKNPKEQTEWMYAFIEPEAEGTPPFAEALKGVTVKVVSNFNKMINKEFEIDI